MELAPSMEAVVFDSDWVFCSLVEGAVVVVAVVVAVVAAVVAAIVSGVVLSGNLSCSLVRSGDSELFVKGLFAAGTGGAESGTSSIGSTAFVSVVGVASSSKTKPFVFVDPSSNKTSSKFLSLS